MVVSATASTAPPPLVPPVDSVDTFVFGSAVVRATENGARRPQRSMGLWVQGRVGTGWGGAGDSAKTIKMEWGLENYYPEWSMCQGVCYIYTCYAGEPLSGEPGAVKWTGLPVGNGAAASLAVQVGHGDIRLVTVCYIR